MINNIFVDLHRGNEYIRIFTLFGKRNLEHLYTKEEYIVFYNKEYDMYIPIKNNTSNDIKNALDMFLEDNIVSIDCKKYVLLPTDANTNSANEYLENLINVYKNTIPILFYINTDDFPRIPYNIEKYNIKVIASTNYHYNDRDVELMVDSGLSLCYFYYLNLWSLTNFDLVFDNKTPKDKVFCYSKRFYDNENSRRKYWFDRLSLVIPNEYIKTSNLLDTPYFKNANLVLASNSLASYFDYNECMFNLVNESDDVYDPNGRYNVDKFYKFTEKTLYAILFANPSLLICRPQLIDYLNNMGIVVLNNEFEFSSNVDFKICFDNFCNFIANSNSKDRKNLYNKYKHIQQSNRNILINYIEGSKNEILEYILK
jgi:hypothetical protein